MRNRIIDAFLYLFIFFVIQFVVTYAVLFAWLAAEGKSIAELGKGFADGSLQVTAPMFIVISAIYSVITLIIFLWRKWSVVSPHYLRTRPFSVLLWAAIAALGTIIPSEVFLELVPLPDVNSQLMGEIMSNRWGYLSICIFAPLVEELVFRGAILRALLQGMGRHWVAIVMSALLFALIHMNPAQMPHAFLVGMLLGWIYWRTGSILPTILFHWVNNSTAYVVYNLLPQSQDMKLIDLFGSERAVILSVVFSLLILLPAIYQLHLRMRRV